MKSEIWIALDGGTTNTRGTVVIEGTVTETVKFDVGVRDTKGAGDNAVKAAVRACLEELLDRIRQNRESVEFVASGMLGSEAGLVDLPHVMAPANAMDLARGSIVWRDPLSDRIPIRILPGIRTGPSNGTGSQFEHLLAQDIMRGEETQVIGIREWLLARNQEFVSDAWLLLWPGSNTKLIAVEPDGTIAGSFTSLAGETYAALRSATLLKRSVPDESTGQMEEELLDQAVDAVETHGLLRAAFWTRVADITSSLDRERRGHWLSAIVTAEDVRSLSRQAWVRSGRFRRILVGGESGRQAAYVRALRRSVDTTVEPLEDEAVRNAAALGAVSLGRLTKSIL